MVVGGVRATNFVSPIGEAIPPVGDRVICRVGVLVRTGKAIATSVKYRRIATGRAIVPACDHPRDVVMAVRDFQGGEILGDCISDEGLRAVPYKVTVMCVTMGERIFVRSPANETIVSGGVARAIASRDVVPRRRVLHPPARARVTSGGVVHVGRRENSYCAGPVPQDYLAYGDSVQDASICENFRPSGTQGVRCGGAHTANLAYLARYSKPAINRQVSRGCFSSASAKDVNPSPFYPKGNECITLCWVLQFKYP